MSFALLPVLLAVVAGALGLFLWLPHFLQHPARANTWRRARGLLALRLPGKYWASGLRVFALWNIVLGSVLVAYAIWFFLRDQPGWKVATWAASLGSALGWSLAFGYLARSGLGPVRIWGGLAMGTAGVAVAEKLAAWLPLGLPHDPFLFWGTLPSLVALVLSLLPGFPEIRRELWFWVSSVLFNLALFAWFTGFGYVTDWIEKAGIFVAAGALVFSSGQMLKVLDASIPPRDEPTFSLVARWGAWATVVLLLAILGVGGANFSRLTLFTEVAAAPTYHVDLVRLQREADSQSVAKNESHEWTFDLPRRPALARLQAEVYHSGFNAPMRVEINDQEAGFLQVNLPTLQQGPFRFFRVPRPGTPEGFSFVADALAWRPAALFVERHLLKPGSNRLRLTSTLDSVNLRNLALEVLPELPRDGTVSVANQSPATPPDNRPLSLPPLVMLQSDGWTPHVPNPAPQFTALYFSAEWCGPCRVLTPRLIEWYQRIRPRHPEFELIFVSRDNSAEEMLAYVQKTKMPWPAVPFDQIEASGIRRWGARGIPYLILFGPDGRPVNPGAASWRPPQEVMREAEELLAKGSSQESAE